MDLDLYGFTSFSNLYVFSLSFFFAFLLIMVILRGCQTDHAGFEIHFLVLIPYGFTKLSNGTNME